MPSTSCAAPSRTSTSGAPLTSRCIAAGCCSRVPASGTRHMLPETRTDGEVGRTLIVAEVVVRTCRAEDLSDLEWFGLYRHHREIFADAFARHLRGQNIMLVADMHDFPVGQAWIDLTK